MYAEIPSPLNHSAGRYVRCVCGAMWIVVAVWSAVNVAGTRLRDIAPKVGTADDPENWQKVHKDVINRYDGRR